LDISARNQTVDVPFNVENWGISSASGLFYLSQHGEYHFN